MVTGSTLRKELLFKKPEELDLLQEMLLELADQYQWLLEAWAIFPNHYHFIAQSPETPELLRKLVTHFHASSAKKLNTSIERPDEKSGFNIGTRESRTTIPIWHVSTM